MLMALYRLRWIGYVGRMIENRLPKQTLFGKLLSLHRLKLRWRDVMQRDSQNIGFDSIAWYAAVHEHTK